MRHSLRRAVISAFGCLFTLSVLVVSAADLQGIRAVNDVGHTRVVLDMKTVPEGWKITYNDAQKDVRLILPGTRNINQKPVQYSGSGGVLKGVAVLAGSGSSTLTVELKAKQTVKYNTFILKNPDRLVIDLFTNYEQKTTTEVNSHLDYTRWDRSSGAGRLKIYMVEADKNAAMKVVQQKAAAVTAGNASSVPVVLGVRPERSDTDGTGKRELVTTRSQLDTKTTLRYVPGRGYSLIRETPRIVVAGNKQTFAVAGIDRARSKDEMILYTAAYGKQTGTNVYGREIVIKNNKVVRIGKGNSAIGADEFVLSGHGTKELALEKLKTGDKLSVYIEPALARISVAGATTYTGGLEVLRNGKYVKPLDSDYRDARTPRSFIGVTNNGGAVLVAIDGYSSSSVGVTSQEGSELLRSLGIDNGIEVSTAGHSDLAVKGQLVNKENSEGEGRYTTELTFQ